MVEAEVLQVLEHDPAVTVDDRLRQPGGAARVDDPERMVEWHPLEREGLVDRRQNCRQLPFAEMGHDHGLPHAGHRSGQSVTSSARGHLAAVAVAVDRQQDGRLDLGEPVDDRSRPEIR